MANTHESPPGEDHSYFHIVPISLLVRVLLALLMLTVVTVAVSYVNLGPFNLAVALFIAFIKAALVVVFFMHLKWDKPFNAVVFGATLLFLVLFISSCILDAKEYEPKRIRDWREPMRDLPQYVQEVKAPN